VEKISSILPANSRIKSVDMKESQPVRPGTPTFGRTEGWNSAKDKVTISELAKEGVIDNVKEPVYKNTNRNPREISRSKMVEELNRKFFDTRLAPPATEKINEDFQSKFEYSRPELESFDKRDLNDVSAFRKNSYGGLDSGDIASGRLTDTINRKGRSIPSSSLEDNIEKPYLTPLKLYGKSADAESELELDTE